VWLQIRFCVSWLHLIWNYPYPLALIVGSRNPLTYYLANKVRVYRLLWFFAPTFPFCFRDAEQQGSPERGIVPGVHERLVAIREREYQMNLSLAK
jgi:hypothetical protein